ncbi:MAG TPA: DinB family protein [Streptosporangiaceae bacterium]|nr:DinB family protein [Streptosporangiaceae bacterium]
MTDDIHAPADRLLLTFLDAQRRSVLAIVEGLSDDDLRKPVVPSGWTPLGLIEHLAGAEYYWFHIIAAGAQDESSRPEETDEGAEDGYGPFTTTDSKEAVFGLYREQCEQANDLLAATPLSTPPRGRVHPGTETEVFDLRGIVLHLIEETARHAGHLDIARELIDGKTGLGPR